jgi:16S rRNA (cytidine1402-2'-O)-methyltransferase
LPGKLYVVATPIGNLDDITLRALETLRRADVILAEDTRRSRALLSHFEIGGKPLLACNAHASPAKLAGFVERVARGETLALVTDAGTPSVSDPGTALVRAMVEAGLEVVPIPGVSAVTAAVASAGLVEGSFYFLGFPPAKGKERREFFERVSASLEPVVLFEAPHRIARTLEALAQIMPERRAVLCRELTKIHEEFRRGSLAELAADPPSRGEITLVIAGAPATVDVNIDLETLDASILQSLAQGSSARSVVEELLEDSGLSRRDLYRRVMNLARLPADGAR